MSLQEKIQKLAKKDLFPKPLFAEPCNEKRLSKQRGKYFLVQKIWQRTSSNVYEKIRFNFKDSCITSKGEKQ